MILKQFIFGFLENNNYLLIDEVSKEAVLIDCTENSEKIGIMLKETGAKLKYLLLTHGHFDHVMGVNSLRNDYDCKVLINEADVPLLNTMSEHAMNFGLKAEGIAKVDGYLKDEEVIKLSNIEIKVIFTPGHTKGGVCFLIGDKLFSGDTIFYESVGRTDLPGGNFQELVNSIQSRIFALDENVKIYPGHGICTTVGHEKINNKFL